MKSIRFRKMSEEDIAQAVDIEQEVFSRPWTRENFWDSLMLPDSLYLVAQHKDTEEIVGYCGCYQSFEVGNITNVAVRPDMRRQGIAKGLLTNMFELGQKKGIEIFVLEVRVSNLPAIRLYESYGFKMAGRRKNFYVAPVEDAYIMVRNA